jgi:hypothetical protein
MASDRLQRWGKRWNQGVTLVIVVNLLLVVFNLSYVSLRGIYLRYLPTVVRWYDPVKGIEPHPVTQDYLSTVGQLQRTVNRQGLTASDSQALLADLREQSQALIGENPFFDSNQGILFAKLKRRIRGYTPARSAQAAFDTFWQTEFLADRGWQRSMTFFDQQIAPLLERNYYRATLVTGQYVDEFWRVDVVFVVIFGVELLGRTLIISRRQQGINWLDAIARRWYELPLVLPFWRWLRLVPAAVRVHRSGLMNVERLLSQATHEPAAYLADRVSKFVLVRLVNQTQDAVKTGALLSVWQAAENETPDDEPGKLDRLTDRLVQLVIYRVVPTLQPDIEALLRHSLRSSVHQSNIYEGLRQIPGLEALPASAVDSIADYLAQATCDVLADAYADVEGRQLMDRLSRGFRQALGQELQDAETSAEVRSLLYDLLDELKETYIQRSESANPEATLNEVETLRQRRLPPFAAVPTDGNAGETDHPAPADPAADLGETSPQRPSPDYARRGNN